MASAQTAASEFRAEFAECARHGTWQRNVMVDGVERWHSGCPRCAQEATARSLLARAAIPLRFQDRRFDTYRADSPNQQAALNVTRQYAQDFEAALANGRCLVLLGNPGCGKTHLAVAIAHQIMDAGFTALFVHAFDLVTAIRATWGGGKRTEDDVLRELTAFDLLIIDEVGAAYNTESELVEQFKVINRRYEAMRPTIIISNHNLEGVEQCLGARAFDRLRENGGRVVVFDWQSYRGRS